MKYLITTDDNASFIAESMFEVIEVIRKLLYNGSPKTIKMELQN